MPAEKRSWLINNVWTLSGLFLLLVMAGFAGLGIWSWAWTQGWLLKQLSIQSELVANTADELLISLDTGLPVLGEELGDAPVEPTRFAYITLSGYLKTHPYVANLIVYSPSGNMLLNTAVPYGMPLPTPPQGSPYIDQLKKTLAIMGMQFARTHHDVYSDGWHLTARYVLRSGKGVPLAIIQANIPTDLLTGQWASMNLSPGTGMGLLRTDGYILDRLPLNLDKKGIFAHHFNGGLVHALRKSPNRSEGDYIGRVQVDNTYRIGAYTRLLAQPVVAFVSLPGSYVWNVWIRQVLPSLVIGFLSLVAFVIFFGRYMAHERAHARSLANERDLQAWTARHDPLTRLPNRTALEDRLSEAQARSIRGETLLAVGLFDLDDFKQINDQYGHDAGDQVLRHVSGVFTQYMRKTDFVGRLGGDEFVLLFEDLDDLDTLMAVLSRLEAHLKKLVDLSEYKKVSISGTMGITIYPFDEAEGDVLLRHADRALYHGKSVKHTRNHFWTLFESEWAKGWHQTQTRTKIDQGQLIVHYQPILDLRTRAITGLEALVRLYDPKTDVTLYPSHFLKDVVSNDDQFQLVHLVLKQVDEDIQLWDRAGLDTLSISINLPPIFLKQSELNERLLIDLENLKIPAERIIFEVLETEGDFTLDHGSDIMLELKGRGFRFALDDVGSAYSTLLRLKDLPVDSVKLDQGFVRELSAKPEDLIFVEALYDIADVMQIDFIAEGVETLSILDAMIALGIPKVQGYAIARPLPASEFLDWLHQYQPPPEKAHTLLGLYATHRKRDYFIHGLLTKNPDLLKSPADVATLEEGDVSHLLRQLGHGDTHLYHAYDRYRETLTSIMDSHFVDLDMVSAFKKASEAFDKMLEMAIKT